MHIEAGRVDSVLDAQRLASPNAIFQLLPETIARLDLMNADADQFELLIDQFHESFQRSAVSGQPGSRGIG
jgi:hypothetical protein